MSPVRDPRLFYLTMEVNIGEARSRTIALEDSSCIADLITCNPWGTCKFRLKSRQGGLVKIHDSEIRTDSVYKSIILSQDTTVEDTISILRNCYHREGNEEDYSLYEFCTVTLTSRLPEGSEIRPDSVYKSIILSQETTVEDTISILRKCYHREGNEDYTFYVNCL